jgi:hypothetical protein
LERNAAEPLVHVGGADLPPQGYRLVITSQGITIDAADAAGAFYARTTLDQLRHGNTDGTLSCLEIVDSPDFPVRGVMLDISRNKVPTMATLRALIDELARLKINHIELYMEHTFAYQDHRTVWEHADPITAEEIRELDAYCRERFIELVPNQNSFGHLERWLKHPRYTPLAECPEGFDFPWGEHSGPFSLNPLDPRSIALIDELYGELLPNFSSREFNVGCDETFDLGLGRSREECERRGKGRVYLDFLLKLRDLVHKHGRRMHFWADIIHHYPELLSELPRDMVAHEWGYETDHPYAEHCQRFQQARVPFYVCPGTCAWLCFGGRTQNCLATLRMAAEQGLRHGAIGYLITDWGDGGHWQYPPVSYLGFAAGAAFSWCLETNRDCDWPMALDTHIFRDSAGVMGRLAHDLGNVYLLAAIPPDKNRAIFLLLNEGADHEIFKNVTVDNLHAILAEIDAIMPALQTARMQRPDASLIVDEFVNTAAFMRHACHRALAIKKATLHENGAALAEELKTIVAEHRRLWLVRNRPGGLSDSVRSLNKRLSEYEAAQANARTNVIT